MSALPECAPSALTARSPTNSTPPPPSTVSLYCGQRPKHAPRHIEIANSLIAEPSRGGIDSAAALDGTDPRSVGTAALHDTSTKQHTITTAGFKRLKIGRATVRGR